MNRPTLVNYPIAAIGDLHGNLPWLEALIHKLERLEDWPTMSIVFVGDLVDRGPDVAGAVERVSQLLANKPGSVAIMGNHDFALVNAAGLGHAPVVPSWRERYRIHYDHERTFQSYWQTYRNQTWAKSNDWNADLAELKSIMPEHHQELLANLPWLAEAAGHLFVHCGLSDKLDEPATTQLELLRRKCWHGYVTPKIGTDTHRMYNPDYPVWLGADKQLSSRPLAVPGRVIVSGHVHVSTPDLNPTRIRIDTSGGLTPPLTACILRGVGEPPEFITSH